MKFWPGLTMRRASPSRSFTQKIAPGPVNAGKTQDMDGNAASRRRAPTIAFRRPAARGPARTAAPSCSSRRPRRRHGRRKRRSSRDRRSRAGPSSRRSRRQSARAPDPARSAERYEQRLRLAPIAAAIAASARAPSKTKASTPSRRRPSALSASRTVPLASRPS